ncbi:MAG TPA: methyltransferase domain-containing protein [Pyrinomonadaceae bacterium]|nr:methyltransferase domain-containing protein [Pyrinomonadaceae bacterium]
MVECNACGWTGNSFGPLWGHESVVCPECGSFERHRAIIHYLERANVSLGQARVLEVGSGAARAFKLYFERRGCEYFSLDLWPGHGTVRGDAAALPFKTGAFDVVISLHVLEHLGDDFEPLSEMFRVASREGLVMAQVPYDDSRFDTIEHDIRPGLLGKSEYYDHHKRDYGLDIIERLGFFVRHVVEVHPLLFIPGGEARRHSFERNFGTTFFCSDSDLICRLPGRLDRDLIPLKRRWLAERRAYELYLARNGQGGELQDWLQAEAEVGRLRDDEVARSNVFSLPGREEDARAEGRGGRHSRAARR